MADVANTIETIEDLKDVLCDAIEAYKSIKSPFTLLAALAGLAKSVSDLLAEFPAVMPELLELDADEAGEITKASYECIQSVITCLKGHE